MKQNIRVLVCILVILSWSIESLGKNSLIAALWSQWQQGGYCDRITRSDIQLSGLGCSASNQQTLSQIGGTASGALEELVFREGAKDQVIKNDCLSQQIKSLKEDRSKRNLWLSFLVSSWLGLKKSELILKTCQLNFLNRLSPAEINRYGLEKAYDRYQEQHVHFQSPKIDNENNNQIDENLKKWRPVCLNVETIHALQLAPVLFQNSVPVASASSLFEFVEKNRNSLSDNRTGRPLTDADLLSSDLNDLSFLKVKATPEFQQNLNQALSIIQDDRTQVSEQIKTSLASEHFEKLDTDLKNYIYEDGTIHQVLFDNGLISDPSTGVNNGAACIIARYQPTSGGELVDFGVTTVAGGAILGALLKGVGLLKVVSAAKDVKRTLTLGAIEASLKELPDKINNSCFSGYRNAKTSVDLASNNLMVAVVSSDLPADIAYQRWDLSLDEKTIPACRLAASKNLAINSTSSSNCVKDMLSYVLPLRLSLPFNFIYQ